MVAQERKPQRRTSFDGRRMAGPFPFRFLGGAWGVRIGFRGNGCFCRRVRREKIRCYGEKPFRNRALSAETGGTTRCRWKGAFPSTARSGRSAAGCPSFPGCGRPDRQSRGGANAEVRRIGERSNRTGLGGRQASSAHGRSGHLCRGRKGRNARLGFGGAWSAGEECMPAFSGLREAAVFDLCVSSGESGTARSLRPGNFVRFRWGDGHRNLFNPMQNTIFGTFFGLRNFSPLRLRTNPSGFGADGRKTRAGEGRAGPGYGTNDRQNRL